MSLTAPNTTSSIPTETRTKRTRSGLRVFWSTIPSQDHPDSNEDAVLIDTVLDIAAVFDGVGGYEGGEVASRIAAHAVLAVWRRQSETAKDLPTLRAVMRESLLEADRQVRAAVERQPDLTGMATTAIVTKIWETPDHRRLLLHGHVGDSRLYVLRARGSLDRVTIDDGILSTHVALGLMTEEEALMIDQAESWNDLDDRQKRYFYQRGLITQAIGGRGEPDVHVSEVELYPGDRVLVCSDGIHDNLTEAEITHLLRKPGRNDGDTLVKAARRRAQRGLQATLRSKPDDMSAVVVDVAPAPLVSAQPRAGKTQPTRRARTTAKTKPAPKTAPTTKAKTAAGTGSRPKAKTGAAKKSAKEARPKASSSAPTK
ncbi:MAG TPA: protein phosphatase 2C domain-containing protein [Ktedonobacterales bacterium]|nr:protein phosphatase 2C domain-containing protein [Ktedonobacterales bacterium]